VGIVAIGAQHEKRASRQLHRNGALSDEFSRRRFVRGFDPGISLQLLDCVVHAVGNDLDDVQLDDRSNSGRTCQQSVRLALIGAVGQLDVYSGHTSR
jgi:hypothetical protein